MPAIDLASDVTRDLLRSGWIIESARALTYENWGDEDSASDSRERAAVIAGALEKMGRGPDPNLVDLHAAWIGTLVAQDEPVAATFVLRLGDWVDAHVSPFLGSSEQTLKDLGGPTAKRVLPPTEMPSVGDFARIDIPELDPPGNILFTFAILSDLHVGSRGARPLLETAIADINRSGAAFVVQLGDLTDRGERAEFTETLALLDRFEIPVTVMMGNHDVFSMSEERLSGRDYFTETFGRPPDGTMFEHGGFRFAVLDSVEHSVSPFGPFDMLSGKFIEGSHSGALVRGSLTSPQHDILAELAAPDGDPAFVFLHHPPQPFAGFPPVVFGLRDEDTGRLHATCDAGNVWGVFAGHTHRNARTRDFDGVPAHEVAIPRDFPHGYALVDVCEEGYRYRFLQISDDDVLRTAYDRSGALLRRYALGRPEDLAFVWHRS